jgi:uncharacterized protein
MLVNISPLVRKSEAPPAFHMLSKPTGAACNLDCKYCFFLSKDMLYPKDPLRMSDEMLEAYIKQLLESHQTPTVNVAWQGGEPTLMGLDFYKRSIEYVEQYRRPGQQVEYTFQTNGVLIDDEWARFFKENKFLLGLSVDGPQEMHDTYRVTKAGNGTFKQVMRGFEYLRKHGVDYNILCTVNAANEDHGCDVYRFFRDELHAEFIQFIPIIERASQETLPLANLGWSDRPGGQRLLYTQAGNLVTERSVKPEKYGRFLIDVFEEWVRRDVGKVYVQLFDVTLEAYFGSYSLCIHAPTCGSALAIEHNGDVYSCDHFVEPDYKLGNISERHMLDLVASPAQRQFGNDKQAKLTQQCLDCDVRFLCNGGCPKDRFVNSLDGEPGHNYLCAGLKSFFDHVNPAMQTMAQLVRSNRAPAEIMQMYAEKEFAGGRNDHCHCGSGRKFKRCHGQVTVH